MPPSSLSPRDSLSTILTKELASACISFAVAIVPLAAQADPTAVESTDTPASFAYNYGEVETTRSAAMGGALRAAGNGTTGMFLNPANLALTRIYHIEAIGEVTPETGRQVYGGALVDSTTNRLAGGTAVTGGFMDPSGTDRSWIDIRMGLAFPISDVIYVGLGGRYLKLTENGDGPFGKSSKASGGLKDPNGGRLALVVFILFMINEPNTMLPVPPPPLVDAMMGGPVAEYTGAVVKAPELKFSARIEKLPLEL